MIHILLKVELVGHPITHASTYQLPPNAKVSDEVEGKSHLQRALEAADRVCRRDNASDGVASELADLLVEGAFGAAAAAPAAVEV